MKFRQYIPTFVKMPELADEREIVDRQGNLVAVGIVCGVYPKERVVLIQALKLDEEGYGTY